MARMSAGSSSAERGATRGRKGLSAERVARAPLELIDEEGVGAASMRAIASRLGVEGTSTSCG
jgi:AcrR family transcriptional regulator